MTDLERLENARKSIIPLTALINGEIIFLGTAFYISEYGGFVSAKHVFDHKGKSIVDNIVAIVPNEHDVYIPRRISSIDFHPMADIAVGLLTDKSFDHGQSPKAMSNFYNPIDLRTPKITDSVFSYSYPKSIVVYEGEEIKGKFRIEYFQGAIEDIIERNDFMLKGQVYQSTKPVLSGASGGPAFNDKGRVIGVNSTGYDIEGKPISYITPIKYALDIEIGKIKGLKETFTLKDIIKEDYENMEVYNFNSSTMTRKQWIEKINQLSDILSTFQEAYDEAEVGETKFAKKKGKRKLKREIEKAEQLIRTNQKIEEILIESDAIDQNAFYFDEFRKPGYFEGDMKRLLFEMREMTKTFEEEE